MAHPPTLDLVPRALSRTQRNDDFVGISEALDVNAIKPNHRHPSHELGGRCGGVDLRTPDPTGRCRMVGGYHDFSRLWNALVKKSGQPSISLYLEQRMAYGPAIPILFAPSTAPNLATGVARFSRFK